MHAVNVADLPVSVVFASADNVTKTRVHMQINNALRLTFRFWFTGLGLEKIICACSRYRQNSPL